MKTMTTIKSPQELGDALRSARKQLGLTQPQLALAAGVRVRFIVDLESGKSTVRLDSVLRVIDALGGVINLDGLPVSSPPILCGVIARRKNASTDRSAVACVRTE
jgi:HTH-type transcriptional regulator/antitoxin HipB